VPLVAVVRPIFHPEKECVTSSSSRKCNLTLFKIQILILKIQFDLQLKVEEIPFGCGGLKIKVICIRVFVA
jgi:hypothetical protein